MSEILKVIKERHSSRVPFDSNKPVSKENLKQILEAARWTPTGHNMQNYEIIVIEDKTVLEKIGNLKSRILEEFLSENYEHLSFTKEELEQKKVGILAAGFPPDWVDPSKFSQIAQDSAPIPLEKLYSRQPNASNGTL